MTEEGEEDRDWKYVNTIGLYRYTRSDIVRNIVLCMWRNCSVTSYVAYHLEMLQLHSKIDIVNAFGTPLLILSFLIMTVIYTFENNTEALTLNFAARLQEPYNSHFSMNKLLAALDRSPKTSSGPEGKHNQMLSHPPPTRREFLMCILVLCDQKPFSSALREAAIPI
jgi:hypothetical protein